MARRRKRSGWAGILLLLCASLIAVGMWTTPPKDAVQADMIAPTSAPGSIRLASWNIRQLGGRTGTDLRKVAQIITTNSFDVVAIQELQGSGAGLDRLLNELGPPWRATRLGDVRRSGERLAYIYRSDRVTEAARPADLAGADDRVFERVPYCATFRAGNFDCELITAHFSWGDRVQRQGEMEAMARLVAAKVRSQGEKDVIVLGDLNEQKARPNLDYMTKIGWLTVMKTGTNLSSREIYDHILLGPGSKREYLRSGVVHFDEILFANDDKAAADAISDHRPIWADFAINLADDD